MSNVKRAMLISVVAQVAVFAILGYALFMRSDIFPVNSLKFWTLECSLILLVILTSLNLYKALIKPDKAEDVLFTQTNKAAFALVKETVFDLTEGKVYSKNDRLNQLCCYMLSDGDIVITTRKHSGKLVSNVFRRTDFV